MTDLRTTSSSIPTTSGGGVGSGTTTSNLNISLTNNKPSKLTNKQRIIMAGSSTNRPNFSNNQQLFRKNLTIENMSFNSNTTRKELLNAIEELGRENDKIMKELGATQDLLDLFEKYRDLTYKVMTICSCQGKQQLFNQWYEYELDYKRLMPIKARFDPTHVKNNQNNNDNHHKLFQQRLNRKFSKYSYSIPMINDNKEIKINDVTFKVINENTNNITTNNIREERKSLVRAFLDKIKPGTSNNNYSTTTTTTTNNNNNNYIVRQTPIIVVGQQSYQQNIPNNSNFMMKKRKAAYNQTPLLVSTQFNNDQQNSVNKKFKFNNNNHNHNHSSLPQSSTTADHDVERLDKLNHALDQILMGKFDEIIDDDDDDDDDGGGGGGDNNEQNEQQHEENSNLDYISQMLFDEDGQDGQEDQEEKTNESIIMMADDNNNNSQQNNDQNDPDNLPLDVNNNNEIDNNNSKNPNKTKQQTINTTESSNGSSSSNSSSPFNTILSAVLKSGLNPYSKISKNSTQTSSNSKDNSEIAQESTSTSSIIDNQTSTTRQQKLAYYQQTTPVFPGLPKRPHLTNEERKAIISRLKRNESGARIAKDYGITKQAVSAIKRRAQMLGYNFQKYYPMASPYPIDTLNRVKIQQQQQRPNNNLILSASNVPNLKDSLVSRQLKQHREQQKMNATIMKQSSIVADIVRNKRVHIDACDLVLPVDPVAILKSQKQQQQQQLIQQQKPQPNKVNSQLENPPEQSEKTTDDNSNKRLILTRLLQGTDTYAPTYTTAASNSDNQSTAVDQKQQETEDQESKSNKTNKQTDPPQQQPVDESNQEEQQEPEIEQPEEEEDQNQQPQEDNLSLNGLLENNNKITSDHQMNGDNLEDYQNIEQEQEEEEENNYSQEDDNITNNNDNSQMLFDDQMFNDNTSDAIGNGIIDNNNNNTQDIDEDYFEQIMNDLNDTKKLNTENHLVVPMAQQTSQQPILTMEENSEDSVQLLNY